MKADVLIEEKPYRNGYWITPSDNLSYEDWVCAEQQMIAIILGYAPPVEL